MSVSQGRCGTQRHWTTMMGPDCLCVCLRGDAVRGDVGLPGVAVHLPPVRHRDGLQRHLLDALHRPAAVLGGHGPHMALPRRPVPAAAARLQRLPPE